MSDAPSTAAAAKAAAEATRTQLTETLDQIEDRINVPKRIGEVTKRAQTSFDKNPVPFVVGGVVAAAGVVGLVIRAVASRE